ncbi:MAG: hypothetical protein Q9165_008543 [Trypethelium subeluteriae]
MDHRSPSFSPVSNTPASPYSPPIPTLPSLPQPGQTDTREHKRSHRVRRWMSNRAAWKYVRRLQRNFTRFLRNGLNGSGPELDEYILDIAIERNNVSKVENLLLAAKLRIDTGHDGQGILIHKDLADRVGLQDYSEAIEWEDVRGKPFTVYTSDNCEIRWCINISQKRRRNPTYFARTEKMMVSKVYVSSEIGPEAIIGGPEIRSLGLDRKKRPRLATILTRKHECDNSSDSLEKHNKEKARVAEMKERKESEKMNVAGSKEDKESEDARKSGSEQAQPVEENEGCG